MDYPFPDSPKLHMARPGPLLECCTKCSGQRHLHLCTGCRLVQYCGTECQKKDWKSHKNRCRTAKHFMAQYEGTKAEFLEEIREIIDMGENIGHIHGGDLWKVYMEEAVGLAQFAASMALYGNGHEYKAVMKALCICFEAVYLSLPYLHCAEATFSFDYDSEFQILKALIPVFLLRLSMDKACYNFVRFWQRSSHSVHMILGHNDDFVGLFGQREEACASLMQCAPGEFKECFKPEGRLAEAQELTEKMNILDEDIPFERIPPHEFDLFQPIVSDVPCSLGNHRGWESLPWQPHFTIPLAVTYMAVLRDLRNLSHVNYLKSNPKLPNEIIDQIRYCMPETELILGMRSLRIRASGDYNSEIAIVQKNISCLLLALKKRSPDYWPIALGIESPTGKTGERYGPLLSYHLRLLKGIPNGTKMGQEILEKVWRTRDYSTIDEKLKRIHANCNMKMPDKGTSNQPETGA